MRFHLLGLAHVPTSKKIFACAYTQKVVNLAKMLAELGHKVYLYCTEGSSVPNVEMIEVVREETRRRVYGDYDWRSQFFKHDPKDEVHLEFNANAIREINTRKQQRDFLLCPMGNYDKMISDAVGLMTVESGIGYEGVFCDKRVFESYAWMHYIYGLLKQGNGSWYDVVIPNAYDLADFPYSYVPKEDYFLFVGRLISRKGLQVAIETTEKLGVPLIVAGQGDLRNVDGRDFSRFAHVRHVGSVDPAQRFELMRYARAVLAPTYYIGPFEGVAVEAQLSGTPVITTDWGVFAETVQNGVTGFRCRTLAEFVKAAKDCDQIAGATCRAWAERYSTEVIKHQYQDYFDRVYDLWDEGWYQFRKDKYDDPNFISLLFHRSDHAKIWGEPGSISANPRP
jgi:glycosyltransferase involved in cell wall biosynthesis